MRAFICHSPADYDRDDISARPGARAKRSPAARRGFEEDNGILRDARAQGACYNLFYAY